MNRKQFLKEVEYFLKFLKFPNPKQASLERKRRQLIKHLEPKPIQHNSKSTLMKLDSMLYTPCRVLDIKQLTKKIAGGDKIRFRHGKETLYAKMGKWALCIPIGVPLSKRPVKIKRIKTLRIV